MFSATIRAVAFRNITELVASNRLRTGLLLLSAGLSQAQSPLTPNEARGKEIFERGAGPGGQPITATMAGGEQVPGAVLPCANCHGRDGRGKPEAGTVPSDIRWATLTRPYTVSGPGGRTHGPYNERLLKRAFTLGADPAGNLLAPTMPHFQMALRDADDLIAYIKRLGNSAEPGVSDDRVRLGILLPPDPDEARMIREAVEDRVAQVNAADGIFRRSLEVISLALPANAAERGGAVRAFLSREPIFAILFADFTGAEARMSTVLSDTGTPAVAGIAPFPDQDQRSSRDVFYLDGGLDAELSALADFASKHFEKTASHPVIVSSPEERSGTAANRLKTYLEMMGFNSPVIAGDPARFTPGDLTFWLRPDTPPVNGTTIWLMPGSIIGQMIGQAASAFSANGAERVLVSLGPGDGAGSVSRRAAASAEILIEGLRRAGRGVTRTALLDAIESISAVESSLGSPLSFGPARHVGANGVRIMEFDSRSGRLVAADSPSGTNPTPVRKSP